MADNYKYDLSGQQFGNLVVIGETGKTNKNNQKILLARNIESGEFVESITTNFIHGKSTGYKGSKISKEQGKKYGKQNSKTMNEKIIRDGVNISALICPPRSNNSTGYTGIIYEPRKVKWEVILKIAKTTVFRKSFLDFEDAVKAKINADRKFVLPILTVKEKELFLKNNPKTVHKNEFVIECQKMIDDREKIFIQRKISKIGRTKGYFYDKKRNKFTVQININGKQKHLGRFDTEQEAKAARQKAVDEQIKKLEKEMEQI